MLSLEYEIQLSLRTIVSTLLTNEHTHKTQIPIYYKLRLISYDVNELQMYITAYCLASLRHRNHSIRSHFKSSQASINCWANVQTFYIQIYLAYKIELWTSLRQELIHNLNGYIFLFPLRLYFTFVSTLCM